MTQYWKSITNYLPALLICLALPSWLYAQDEEALLAADKERALVFVDLELDYGTLIARFTDFAQKTEAAIGIGYKERIRFMFAYGTGAVDPQQAILNGSYRAEGDWLRYGADYLLSIDQRNWLGLGIRFGSSSFSDRASFGINSAPLPTSTRYNRYMSMPNQATASRLTTAYLPLTYMSSTALALAAP